MNMNYQIGFRRGAIFAGLCALTGASLSAGTFTADFNDATVPAGSAVYGSTIVDSAGGVDGGGVLKLTQAVNSQTGSFVVDDLDPGSAGGLNSFTADFKMRVGGGTATPADGFSFSVGSDLPAAAWSEEGPTTTGLVVAFDIYDNAGGEAPAIDLRWNGVEFRHLVVPLDLLRTGAGFVDVMIKVDPDGTFDLTYNGTQVYSNVFIPNFAPMVAAKFGFGARTGGLNENQWVDDLTIATTTGDLQVAVTQEPADVTVLANAAATLRVAVNSSDPSLNYQWFRKGPTDAGFTAIAGANEAILVTAPLSVADAGTQYRLTVTGLTEVTTRAATVSVVDIPPPVANLTLDFGDGAVPSGTAVFGTAAVGPDGFVHLTEAANDQNGAFTIEDINGGQAVDSLDVRFQLQLGPGSTPPADGFSFNWASDLPNATLATAEEGAGTGLTVSFDAYDSGGGEAPAVDVKFGGTVLASRKLTIQELSLERFADVLIRVRPNGLVDVAYDGMLLHSGVQIPGFSALAGARFGFAARTGGANQAHYLDTISIATTLFTGPTAITRQPTNAVVLVGQAASFDVLVNDPSRSTFQWQRRGPGEATFSNIAAATGSSFTTSATTGGDQGALYRVVVTGPANTVSSEAVSLDVVTVTRPTTAEIDFNFNDGAVPAGTTVLGTAVVTATGGVGDSGVLHLTDAVNGQNGAFVISNAAPSQAVGSFTAAFRMRVGGGSEPPADGFSFNWASDFPAALPGEPENGGGTGLSVGFDIYDNGAAEGPSIDLRWQGGLIASKMVSVDFIRTGDEFADVLVRLNPNGTVTVVYETNVVFYNVPLTNFTGLSGASFAFAARTGGLNENQWVDDIAVDTESYVGPLLITRQPSDLAVLNGQTATLTVEVNDPGQASFQWQRRGPGEPGFLSVPAATGPSLTTAPLMLTDSGTQFRVVVTNSANVLTSMVATITVFELSLPPGAIEIGFNDGAVPSDSAVFGTAAVSANEGVDDSGVLKLTSAVNDQVGSFIVNDLNPGMNIDTLTVAFKARVGEGTSPPADGFSFVWASDLADGTFGEDGAGSGLVVSFDTYDNGAGEAPAVDVRFNSTLVESRKVPASLLDTAGEYVSVLIRVEPDGSVDVVYDGQVVIYNVTIPGFQGLTGGRYAWGARTGGANANHWIDDIQISAATALRILSIERVGTDIRLTYTGVLQSSDKVEGPYTDVPNATSPAVIPIGPGNRFFRTRGAP
ncbi:MAG: hypothetical protein JNN07_16990 [Verrucomicrobiales bacterium]|nr:hypothetical protein [Verrucomicrobiales bacterium]